MRTTPLVLFQRMEEALGKLVAWLARLSIVKFLEIVGKFAILVGIVQFTLEVPQRREAAQRNAFSILDSSRGKPGDMGRQSALELLAGSLVPLNGVQIGATENARADLRGVRLPQAELQHADLCHCLLQRADLSGAKLSHARLESANLEGAALIGADLRFAVLDQALLIGAELSNVDLSDGSLNHADLTGALLGAVILNRTDLSGSFLIDADFRGVSGMEGAILHGTDLRGANLSGINLRGVDFSNAVLVRAKLSGAVLADANFENADLEGADFRELDYKYWPLESLVSQVRRAKNWDKALFDASVADSLAQLQQNMSPVGEPEEPEPVAQP